MAKTAAEKPLSQVIRERRSTQSYEPVPVHEADLKKILDAGLAAPSGYNLQPWRFVVVRDPEKRRALRAAAANQPKVEEAPVVIVACGDADSWREDLDEMLTISQAAGFAAPQMAVTREKVIKAMTSTPGDYGARSPDNAVWINRQVMIAFTHMMLMAEALGYDTTPMEGFSESQVKTLLNIPERVRVVSLLVIGRLRGEDKQFGGRFPLSRLCFAETWGEGLEL
jgi:nitroreductase